MELGASDLTDVLTDENHIPKNSRNCTISFVGQLSVACNFKVLAKIQARFYLLLNAVQAKKVVSCSLHFFLSRDHKI